MSFIVSACTKWEESEFITQQNGSTGLSYTILYNKCVNLKNIS